VASSGSTLTQMLARSRSSRDSHSSRSQSLTAVASAAE
jgi:hypothetical protein